LTVANAANSTSASLARLIGSPLGGLAVGLGGIGTVVLIDGLSFIAVAIATAFVRAGTAPITSDANTGAEVTPGVRAGVSAIRAHRSLRALILVEALGQIAQGFFLVLFVVFVVRRLHGGGVDVGVIRGSMAVGAIISAAVIAKFANRFGPITLLTAGFAGMGVISMLFWNAPTLTTALWVYMVVFGLSGIPGAAMGIGLFTAVQRFSPSGMLGRVVGMSGALDALARAAGSLTAGVLVSRVDLVVLLDTQSVIYLMCGVLAYVFIRDGRAPARRR
jgi:Na+/melibiose symporter-like transporter